MVVFHSWVSRFYLHYVISSRGLALKQFIFYLISRIHGYFSIKIFSLYSFEIFLRFFWEFVLNFLVIFLSHCLQDFSYSVTYILRFGNFTFHFYAKLPQILAFYFMKSIKHSCTWSFASNTYITDLRSLWYKTDLIFFISCDYSVSR